MYNLPVGDSSEYSGYSSYSSEEHGGYKYNIPKSAGPKPETRRPNEKKPKRDRKHEHSR